MKHWLFVAFAFLALSAQANNTVVIAGAHWPGFVEPEGKGSYLALIENAYGKDFSIQWEVNEFERAKNLFLSQRADILVGVYRDSYPDKLYPKAPIDTDHELKAFFMKGRPNLFSVEDLSGKIISWRKGYDFTSFVPNYTEHYPFQDTQRVFQQLMKNRIDVILDYEHNVPPSIREQLDAIVVLKAKPLWIVFHNTDKGKQLLTLYEDSQRQH